MRLGFEGEDWFSIVGVVEDAHHLGLQSAAEELVYWPATIGTAEDPAPTRGMDVTIRTAGDPRALGRAMSTILFDVSAIDPLTYVVVSVILLGVSALASWIPARRAAAVAPSTALRS